MTLDEVYPVGINTVRFSYDIRSGVRRTRVSYDRPDTLTVIDTARTPVSVERLRDIKTRLELDDVGMKDLVRRVAESVIARSAEHGISPHLWGATLLAIRTYAPEEFPLYRHALLSALQHGGANLAFPRDLLDQLLPADIQERSFERLFQYLLEAGCGIRDVIDAWTSAVTARAANFDGSTFEHVSPLLTTLSDRSNETLCEHGRIHEPVYTNIEIVVHGDAGRVPALLVERQFSGADEHGTPRRLSWWHVREILRLLDLAHIDWARSQAFVFRELLVACAASGDEQLMMFVLYNFGDRFHIFSKIAPLAGASDTLERARKLILMNAVQSAVKAEKFGIASALAELLGQSEQADGLRASALAAGQRVSLENTTVLALFSDVPDGVMDHMFVDPV